jgi:hypothetical protein
MCCCCYCFSDAFRGYLWFDADLWLVHLGGQWLLIYLGDSIMSPYLIKHKVNLDLEF